MVKKGGTSVTSAKPESIESQAPSIATIASANPSGSMPNLMSTPSSAPAPVLQSLSISQGVSQGLLIKKTAPSYPATAMRMRIEGSVNLLATISKTGDISTVKILSGDANLARAAADAVKQWKYKPYRLNGEPVEVETTARISFYM